MIDIRTKRRLLARPALSLVAAVALSCSGADSPAGPPAPPAPQITTASLPAAGVGAPYAVTLQASGGDGSYTWALAGGALPAGVSLGSGGTLGGAPTAHGPFEFTVRVSSAGRTAERSFELAVAEALQITSAAQLPPAVVGEAYSATLVAAGGNDGNSWALAGGTLPAGVALESSGVLGGVPEAAGSFEFEVRVTNGLSQSARRTMSLVSQSPLEITTTSLADGIIGIAYAAALDASGGDGSYAWSLAAGALPPGLALGAAGEIAGTPTAAGSFDFTVRASSAGRSDDAALKLTVWQGLQITTGTLPAASVGAEYAATLEASGGDGAYAWTLVSGTLPSGLGLDAGGRISGTPEAPDSSRFTVRVASLGLAAERELALVVVPALRITTASLPEAGRGTHYHVQLEAAGGDGSYFWRREGGTLPPGLSLLGTGWISGWPSTAGTFRFTASVLSAGAIASAEFEIYIADGPCGLGLSGPTEHTRTLGVASATHYGAGGGDGNFVWSIPRGALPPGLSLTAPDPENHWTRVIDGTPTAIGIFAFDLRVEDGTGLSCTREIGITVRTQAAIETSTLPDASFGEPYSTTLVASGGDGTNYAWSIAGGALPAGLELDPHTGEIRGTPTRTGGFGFTVRVTSGQFDAAQKALSLFVTDPDVPPGVSLAVFGNVTACQVHEDQSVYCWGEFSPGNVEPIPVAPAGAPPLRSFHDNRCGILPDGSAVCWILGLDREPVALPGSADLVAGMNRYRPLNVAYCGVTAGGSVLCWPYALLEPPYFAEPFAVGGGVGYARIAEGSNNSGHNCGLTAAGIAHCWGANQFGQLGDGTFESTPHDAPVRVAEDLTWAALSLGDEHTCGITTDGELYCWGHNARGQLGVGLGSGADGCNFSQPWTCTPDVSTSSVPLRVLPELRFRPEGLSSEQYVTCALTTAGGVYCWGDVGRLGGWLHSWTPRLLPGETRFTMISANWAWVCGLDESSITYCSRLGGVPERVPPPRRD